MALPPSSPMLFPLKFNSNRDVVWTRLALLCESMQWHQSHNLGLSESGGFSTTVMLILDRGKQTRAPRW